MHDGLSWAPTRAVFLRRVLMLGLSTFAIFMAITILVIPSEMRYLSIIIIVPLVLTLILLMDDLMRWRQVRDERWQISDGHLIHDGQEGRSSIPLAEIAAVRHRLGNSVVITLNSGQRMRLRHLPYPAHTAEQIDSARPPTVQ